MFASAWVATTEGIANGLLFMVAGFVIIALLKILEYAYIEHMGTHHGWHIFK